MINEDFDLDNANERNNTKYTPQQVHDENINIRKLTGDSNSLFVENDPKETDQEIFKEEMSKKYLIEFKDQYGHIVEAKNKFQKIVELMNEKGEYKNYFYDEYFEFDDKTKLKDKIEVSCKEYFKGMKFVFEYYYIGCPSWNWFYPYKMTPLLSDLYAYLKNILKTNPKSLDFQFQISKPLVPFKHLIFTLPKPSLGLLPKKLAEAVLAPESKIR